MFVEDWAEACEVNARLEAASIIKNRTISQCFLGAAVEKGYETYQLKLVQASCFATGNQGITKKSVESLREQVAKDSARFW